MIPDSAIGAGFLGKYLGCMGTGLSPALLGVGYIVGLNVGIVVASGSILSFNIAIPIYTELFMGTDPALAESVAGAIAQDIAGVSWQGVRRYQDVGTWLGGGGCQLVCTRKTTACGHKTVQA